MACGLVGASSRKVKQHLGCKSQDGEEEDSPEPERADTHRHMSPHNGCRRTSFQKRTEPL
jgi:hypothetical protein